MATRRWEAGEAPGMSMDRATVLHQSASQANNPAVMQSCTVGSVYDKRMRMHVSL
ncbi:MAG TPA: hypothetical protein VMP68_05450 [Candidatus Eisenbacteria bacterium]|nr:hypothetical protein [Candidatus Eisenbacteria bacterium]